MSLAEQQNPMSIFLNALKAPESRMQYLGRFKMFLDFLKLLGTIEKQVSNFWKNATESTTGTRKSDADFVHLDQKAKDY